MRTFVLIDGQSIYHLQKDILHWWIDIERFTKWLNTSNEIYKINWYLTTRPNNLPMASFMNKLTYNEITPVPYIINDNRSRIDLEITMSFDIFLHLGRYDHLILFSGAGCFNQHITHLLAQNKFVTVLGAESWTSQRLLETDAKYIDLSPMRTKLERKPNYVPSSSFMSKT